MSLETIACVAEGVLRSTAEANIGSIFGIGFPALHGGVLQYVDNYQGAHGSGVGAFAARATRAGRCRTATASSRRRSSSSRRGIWFEDWDPITSSVWVNSE